MQMKILALRQRSDEMVTASANAPTQFNNDQVSEEDLNSEVELLNSDDLLRKVVLTTGLAGRSSDAGSRRKYREGSAQVKHGFEDRTDPQDQCDLRKLPGSRSEDWRKKYLRRWLRHTWKSTLKCIVQLVSLSSSTSKRNNTSRD